MTDDPEKPREPQHINVTADDSLHIADSIETRVAQAQAQIATAIGNAHDATVRIEELKAVASTPEERTAAERVAESNEAMLKELQALNTTVTGIRTDNEAGGYKANRIGLIMGGGGWILAGIAILISILIANGVIHR